MPEETNTTVISEESSSESNEPSNNTSDVIADEGEQAAAKSEESERNAELVSQNEDLTAANSSLSEENAKLKEEIAILNHKIKSEYKADALLIAKAMMKENNGIDLNQALDCTLEKFPMFVDRILDLGNSTPGVRGVGSNGGFVKGLSEAVCDFK